MLFEKTITGLKSWGEVFQSTALFSPLAEAVFTGLGLPFPGLENCTPGSNAVFRAGAHILKIFAPEESEIGGEGEYLAEKYGLERAARLGVPAPRILASGVLRDRYVFRWLLLERVEGVLLADAAEGLSPEEWDSVGRQLRQAAERLDRPCRPFHDRGLREPPAERRWGLFPEEFRREREAFLAGLTLERVFVHGDLNADNLMITPEGRLVLIDFADCRAAPFDTELAALVCDMLRFDGACLRGLLEGWEGEAVTCRLLRGLLLHDYGAWIIRDRIGPPQTFHTLKDLNAALERSLSCCLNR